MGALYVKGGEACRPAKDPADRRDPTSAAAVKLAPASELARRAPGRAMPEAGPEKDAHRPASGVARWDAACAVRRGGRPEEGLGEVGRCYARLDILLGPIGRHEAEQAVRARARYGKGPGHPARVSMGNLFVYAHACARTNDARLLYKGDGFTHTDLA